MDTTTALLLLALLICPISMVAMMWMMRKDMKMDAHHEPKMHGASVKESLPKEEGLR